MTTAPPRTGVSSWPALTFRMVATLAALLVLAQAALAGGFLSGHFSALALHSRNGGVVGAVLLAQALAAVVLWRRGGGPAWPVRTAVVQLVIGAVLIPLGEQRILAVHVPLAVALAIGTALMTAWAWRWER